MLHPASDKGWTETGCQICSLTTSESGLTTTCHCQLDEHNRIKPTAAAFATLCLPQSKVWAVSLPLCHPWIALTRPAPPCCARDAPPRSLLFLARGFDRKREHNRGSGSGASSETPGPSSSGRLGVRGEGSSQLRGSDLDQSPLHEANSGPQVSGVSPPFFVSETPSGSVSSYGTIPA